MTYTAPSRRQNKVAEEIAHQAGLFLARENTTRSLITVTHANIAPDLKNVTIFVSILPESAQEETLTALKRLRTGLHEHLKGNTVLRNVPTVDFQLDIGEMNRQRIEAALKEKK